MHHKYSISVKSITGFAALAFLLAGLVVPVAAQTADANSRPNSQLEDSTWTLIDAIAKVFEEKHVSPPVRQQIMLVAARTFYKIGSSDEPANLNREVANLTSDDEFQKWLNEKFVDAKISSGIDIDLLNDSVAKLLVSGLDPRASFITAEANRVNKQLAENQYVGIGIQLKFEDGYSVIVDPFPGGAARMAGALKGDRIMEVDGKSTRGESLGQVVQRLRGPKGSPVSVVVKNKGDQSEPRTLDMVRDVVPIASVKGYRQQDDGKWVFVNQKNGGNAYIKIDGIVGSTASELQDAAREIKAAGAKGLILDMRASYFADVHYANMVADVLVGESQLGMVRNSDGTSRVLTTRADSHFNDLPVAVLAPQSASGPMFALLNALKQRKNTCLVSAAKNIASYLNCYDSFELPGGAGAISQLPFARFEFDSMPSMKDHAEPNRLHVMRAPTDLSQIATLAPTIVEPNADRHLAVARKWLARQKS